MKKTLLLLSFFFSFLAEAQFLGNTDIPLMDGLIPNETESFSFDTPAGQIITCTANTPKPASEVKSFYAETLSALGWQEKAPLKYTRDNDELTLKIAPLKQGSTLKIQLTLPNK